MGFIFGAAHEPKSGLWIRHTLSVVMRHTALGGVFETSLLKPPKSVPATPALTAAFVRVSGKNPELSTN